VQNALRAEVRWNRLASPGDRFGVSCDEDGPAIGPIRLLKRNAGTIEPRSTEELNFVVGHAFGGEADFADKMRGLRAVARAIERGDVAHAMITTQFLHLPELTDDAAFARAINAESLVKAGLDPEQPRDQDGRWTADGEEDDEPSSVPARDPNFIPVQAVAEPVIPFLEQILPPRPFPVTPPFPGDILPPVTGTPDIAVPRTLDNPFPGRRDCDEEWARAKEYCADLVDQGKIPSDEYKQHGRTYEQCVRGQVTEACGGSPVERSPKRKPPKSYGPWT
jgi:hypothetical protein